jgi:rifampicin phosphotransferase
VDSWITDTALSERFPYYTRANADEVGPDPFSPLGWSLIWQQGCIPGVAQGFVEFGVVSNDEYDTDPPQVFANFGGYFYNPMSLSRIMGVRMPGATPEAIDLAYFGDHPGVPPYEPHPDDENEELSVKLGEMMGWVMSTPSYPKQHDASAMARRVVAERPDLSAMTNAELVARARSMAPLVYEAWVPYTVVCLGASLGPGAVQAICGALERSADAVKVLSAIGSVESAEASFQMWDLSRKVAASPAMTAAFAQGVDGLIERLGAIDEAADFLSGWHTLIAEHGHRAPNEWDVRNDSWTTNTAIALDLIDRLRHQSDDRSPHVAKALAAHERERISAELLAMVEGDEVTHGTLQAGLSSAANWLGWREQGKNACIRLIHEAKLALYEVADRMVAAGALPKRQHLFNLLDSELDAFLADPASMSGLIAAREVDFQLLHTLEPPYIVGKVPVPPISQWAKRNAADVPRAVVGDVLQGAPGAPGIVTGRARVVLDPMEAPDMDPGDILVAPTTDPSWMPLFLSVGGVVTNVGAVGSHAAIASRELGVPCAVSVQRATDRIADGSIITMDGSTGTVTIVG